jgi:ribosomal-protein-alanine N-acetyltransferase
MTTPSLTTARLFLRVPTPDDAGALLKFVTENREHLASWEPARDETHFTEGFWTEHLRSTTEQVAAGRELPFIILHREAPESPIVGRCRFSQIVMGPFQAAYLGYALDRSLVGRGFMYEALTAAVGHVFNDLNLHRIMANHVPENDRSARLLDRLGFQREGFAPSYLRIDGHWRDHVLTALTNPHWRSA